MRKLYTVQTGSKLYGTNTPESDLDIKHIYLPELSELLLGQAQTRPFSIKSNDKKGVRNSAQDIDEEFIPLHTFVADFVRGQTYAMEIAQSINSTHAGQTFWDINKPTPDINADYIPGSGLTDGIKVNKEDTLFYTLVNELSNNFMTRNMQSFGDYAVKQANVYTQKGERLGVAHKVNVEFDALIAAGHGKTSCKRLLEMGLLVPILGISKDHPDMLSLGEYEASPGATRACLRLLDKTLPLENSVETNKIVCTALIKRYGDRSKTASENKVDWKAVMHAVRIIDFGIQMLDRQKIELPCTQKDIAFYKEIRAGVHPLPKIEDLVNERLQTLREKEAASTLPPYSDTLLAQAQKTLMGYLYAYYGITNAPEAQLASSGPAKVRP